MKAASTFRVCVCVCVWGGGGGICAEYSLMSNNLRLSVWMLKGQGALIAVKLVSTNRINMKLFSICLI